VIVKWRQQIKRKHWLDALEQVRRAILGEYPILVDQIGGPDVLKDQDQVLDLVLQMGHGKMASYLEGRRKRKPFRLLAHGDHVIELVRTKKGEVRYYYDGQTLQDSFRVVEDGTPAFYEIDRRKGNVNRNGTVMIDIHLYE